MLVTTLQLIMLTVFVAYLSLTAVSCLDLPDTYLSRLVCKCTNSTAYTALHYPMVSLSVELEFLIKELRWRLQSPTFCVAFVVFLPTYKAIAPFIACLLPLYVVGCSALFYEYFVRQGAQEFKLPWTKEFFDKYYGISLYTHKELPFMHQEQWRMAFLREEHKTVGAAVTFFLLVRTHQYLIAASYRILYTTLRTLNYLHRRDANLSPKVFIFLIVYALLLLYTYAGVLYLLGLSIFALRLAYNEAYYFELNARVIPKTTPLRKTFILYLHKADTCFRSDRINPVHDKRIYRDESGLWQFNPHNPKDEIMRFFRNRPRALKSLYRNKVAWRRLTKFRLATAATGVRLHYHAILPVSEGAILKANATHNIEKVLELVKNQATPDLEERLGDIYICTSPRTEDHNVTSLVVVDEAELVYCDAEVPEYIKEGLSHATAGLVVMGEGKSVITRLGDGELGVAQLDEILRGNPAAYPVIQNLRELTAVAAGHTKFDQTKVCQEVIMGGAFSLTSIEEYLESIKA